VIKLEYDQTTNSAYIVLGTAEDTAATTIAMTPQETGGAMVNLDFDQGDRLIGIEIIAAREHLPEALIREAAAAAARAV
jgi:uncharacterized protein YuzE